jgi:phosphoenolpyruvate carboxykinase (ATP)
LHLSTPELIEIAVERGEGVLSAHGCLVTDTVPRTGRSPNDRFIVRDVLTEELVDWGSVNRPCDPAVFEGLLSKVRQYLNAAPDLFVQDLGVGADPSERLPIRIVCENAWQAAFACNMFIRLPDVEQHQPEFTVLHAPGLKADGAADGVDSDAFVIINIGAGLVIIGGTHYAGEIKKSIFSIMNYLLPQRGHLPMHCSANTTGDNTAVFFGLSGTGKTTLSADPSRALVGDDEHGWNEKGVFNFEGGCYAKLIDLSEEDEPAIFRTTRMPGTILENIVLDNNGSPDFQDASKTENTRGSYPIESIDNRTADSMAPHPQNVVFLTCDAFGVLPPISRLSAAQAAYHFISGYTAKVAGTEVGITEPKATFSACFGAPFMPMHPSVYADLLSTKMAEHDTTCWLLNTGWVAGGHGSSKRIRISWTRALLNAALDGTLNSVELRVDSRFGFEIPQSCAGVPSDILNPRETWTSGDDYDLAADRLALMFIDNFEPYAAGCSAEVLGAAPTPVS